LGSDLFRVQVIKRRGPVVRVRYTIVHPDVFAIEGSKNIALQTLTDSYWKCREEYLWDVSDAVRAKACSLAKSHPRKALLERWLAMAHGEEVELTPEEYTSLSSRNASDPPRYASWGQTNGRYTATLRTDYRGFVDAAEGAIASVVIEDPRNHPRREGADDGDPEATLVITVSDGAALHHLFEGLEWDSRVYDFEGYL
jgi:hypothetical protein